MKHSSLAIVLMVAALTIAAPHAHAQGGWTVTNLHPAGATGSYARGTSGTQQVGSARVGGVDRASLWSGTAASRIDLNPAGAQWSSAIGTSGMQQVGAANVGGGDHASLWRGTAASWVDLDPAGARSYALGTTGTVQVGYVSISGVDHASLWTGTAASRIDLNPAGSQVSWAYGASGTRQVGYAYVGGLYRASLWSGTAASWVDLNPAGATSSSAYGTSGTRQVGQATVGGVQRASLWSGTAGSWEDLSLALPGSWGNTFATGIWSNVSNTYVAGFGHNNSTNRDEALLWSRPNCTRPAFTTQPTSTSTCPTGTAAFSVSASGTLPTYRWQLETSINNWVNANNGVLPYNGGATGTITASGVTTDHLQLSLNTLPGAPAFRFRCIVTNACGSATSNAATLTICAADFNCDGATDFFDYDAFVVCFEGGACPPGKTADFDGDGAVDFFDYDAFVVAFETGC